MMVFLQTSNMLNRHWTAIADAVLTMDLRPLYLKAFEIALSPCLSDPLYQRDDYKKHLTEHPFPANPCSVMRFDDFISWITLYELIMRETDTLGSISSDDSPIDAAESFLEDT